MEIRKGFYEGTLCYLVRQNGKTREVLLAKKARKIGVGLWNGYGGGQEEGESLEEAAVRELFAESGGVVVNPADLEKVAVIDFHNMTDSGEMNVTRVHVYLASRFTGEPGKTEEMLEPTWFPIDALPLKELMPADPFWFPRILAHEKFYAKALYGKNQKELLAPVEIREVESFDE